MIERDCKNCKNGVAKLDGNWLHVSVFSDEPDCDNPEPDEKKWADSIRKGKALFKKIKMEQDA